MRERGSETHNKGYREWKDKALISIPDFNPELNELYGLMRSHFDFLNWWPGDTKFEVFVGAILTQQTSWKNAEKAILALKEHDALSLEKIIKIDYNKLEKLIKPSGYYKQKAKRLKEICSIIERNYGNIESLFKLDREALRKALLDMKGIGNETADSIILYAAEKPIFVIDAYTKRIMHRVYNIDEHISYDMLQGYFESRLKENLSLYKDMHAQFVELGKNYCKKKPECNNCPLREICFYFSQDKNNRINKKNKSKNA